MKIRLGPSGIHFFDRRTGLNVLFDETRPTENQWSKAPRQVSIALTNACDLHCPYCYAPKFPRTLSFELLTCWLSELDESGCIGVGFGGGEPTLYKMFAEACRYVQQNTAMACTFTTHAHRLNEPLLQRLQGNVNFVRISMDGVGDVYERLRGRSFPLLLERIKMARSLSQFGINIVINADTIPCIDAVAVLAADLGACEMLLLPEQAVHGREGISQDALLRLQAWIGSYAGMVPLTISESGAEGIPICNPLPEEKGLRAYAHIDASGYLKPSSYSRDGIAIETNGVIGALAKMQDDWRGQA